MQRVQYYKIDLSFSIKLQGINLYVCEEYKSEREARDLNRTERDDRIAHPRRSQTFELRAKRPMRMCPQSWDIF